MEKWKPKLSKKAKKVFSSILAATLVMGSIPASTFLGEAVQVRAATTYSPQKYGVGVLCRDLTTGDRAKEIFNALVRCNSQAEDSRNGSIYNNVGMVGYKYSKTKAGSGETFSVNVQKNYPALYNQSGQISQNLMAYITNDKHKNFGHHWGNRTQYGKIIFGYPTKANNESFWLGQFYDTSDHNSDGSWMVGDRDTWAAFQPWRGENRRAALYVTTKKGCGSCGSAKIQNVSVAFKDETAPKISKITITGDENSDTPVSYFREGQTVYVRVKFSEYVRLADNNAGSAQSKNIKLALSLGQRNTADVTTAYADLKVLKDDIAVFSYKVPKTIGDKTVDFYVSGLADIGYQTSIIDQDSKKNYDRNFVDNKGNTLADSSGTMIKLKAAAGNDDNYKALKKTSSAITDLAGNPLSLDGFRNVKKGKAGCSVTRAYLDTVNPIVEKVSITAEQGNQTENENAVNYLKAGTKVTVSAVLNERIKKISDAGRKKIIASLNIKKKDGSPVKLEAKSISDQPSTGKTVITFQDFIVDQDMVFQKKDKLSYSKKTDYKVMITEIAGLSEIQDYSGNTLAVVGDLRGNTSKDFYLDNEAPTIMIDSQAVSETKTYEMARMTKAKDEVYSLVFSVKDYDTVSGNASEPLASGVIGGKASMTVDLKGQGDANKFSYYASQTALKEDEIDQAPFTEVKPGKKMDLELDLTSQTTDLHLYLKFDENIDYSSVNDGVRVQVSASDINNNTKTVTAKYSYTAKDKIAPVISYESIQLKENKDNSAYQEAVVRIKDAGGINIDNIRCFWLEEGNTLPGTDQFTAVDVKDVTVVSQSGDKVTECLATIRTKTVGANQTYQAALYVSAADIAKNETISEKLADAAIDRNVPAVEIITPETKPNEANKESSLKVRGPITSSINEVELFVAVKDPIEQDAYFIRSISGNAAAIRFDNEEFLDAAKLPYSSGYQSSETGKWSYGTITGAGDQKYEITTTYNSLNDANAATVRERFLAISGNKYYGNVTVAAGTGFKSSAFATNGNKKTFDASKGKLVTKTFTMTPDEYGFSDKKDVKTGSYQVDDTPANTMVIRTKDNANYGQQVKREDFGDAYNPEANGAEYLSSLAGAEFEIIFANQRTGDFVMDDIDCASPNTSISLKWTQGDLETEVYRWNVTPGKSTQAVKIPEGLTLPNGQYKLEVSVSNKQGDSAEPIITTEQYDNIYLFNYDDAMTEAFGISKVTGSIHFAAEDPYQEADKVPYYGFTETGTYEFNRTVVDDQNPDFTSGGANGYTTDVLYLGNCATNETADDISYNRSIQFTVNGMEDYDVGNYWMKVWTGDNEASAKWFLLENYDEENKVLTMEVKPADAKAMFQAEDAAAFYAGGYANADVCAVPVFEGSNTISYELMNVGGVKSQRHEVEIYYSAKAPDFKIEVEESAASRQSISAAVTEADSTMVAKDPEMYEVNISASDDTADVLIKERSFAYTENQRHLYYLLDGYGNLSYQQFYITDVDHTAPKAEFTALNSATSETTANSVDTDGTAQSDGASDKYITNPSFEIEINDDRNLKNADIQLIIDGKDPIHVVQTDDGYGSDWDGSYYCGMDFREDINQSLAFLSENYLVNEDGSHTLRLMGDFKADIDLSKETGIHMPHSIELRIVDEAGNVMETISSKDRDFYGINQRPKIRRMDAYPEDGMVNFEFNMEVHIKKINGIELPQIMYKYMYYGSYFMLGRARDMLRQFDVPVDDEEILLKDYCGISKDGTYEMEYEDIYGNSYTEQFTLEDFFGDYSAQIRYSTVEKTKEDVVATIEGVSENAQISLKETENTGESGIDTGESGTDDSESKADTSDAYTISWNKQRSKATIVFHKNASIAFELTIPGAAEQKTVDYNVTVENIDKEAPADAKVYWRFLENGEVQEGNALDISNLIDQSTTDGIEVWIASESEDLYAANGKELKHTFLYSENMERSYTFEYSDECGNEATPITVTLPDELNMKPYEAPVEEEGAYEKDTTPPEVVAEVYAVYDGLASYFSSWTPSEDAFAGLAEQIGYSGGYKISYTVSDDSQTKLIVKNGLQADTGKLNFNSTSDQIDGVKLDANNNSLLITKPCQITVIAIDKEGNLSWHSLEAAKIDQEVPTVRVEKEGISFTRMRLKFYADDNSDKNNEKGTILPVTAGMQKGMDDEGYYYFREVESNGTYDTVFKDRSGNRAKISTKVTEIDKDAPKISVSSFSPCYVKDGESYEKLPPIEPTNSSVLLSLDFNKTVSELKVYYKQNDNWVEDDGTFSKAGIELGGRKGNVEFFAAVPSEVKIVATSPNGVSGELTGIDLVDIIDKNAPKITVTQKLENNRMNVVFRSDETVFVNGGGISRTYGGNTDISLEIRENGVYDFTFADAAGNVTEKQITVDAIDEIPPVVYASGIPETYIRPEACSVKVTMSEAGTITFRGKEYPVKAPADKDGDGELKGDELDWITLPIAANGSYQVKATDQAGLVSYRVLEIHYLDDIAPSIQFDHSVVNVFQGMTAAELKEQLLDASTFRLWDNIDPNPQISLKTMLSEKQMNEQGIHEVTYLLSDRVENEKLVKRYVKVISSANLKITANGEALLPCDTTILKDNQVDLVLEKSKRNGESFKVYYKKGIQKAGAMKKADVVKDGRLTNLESGFYSLYIVTQNRETYLTYLYVMPESEF